MSTVAETRVVTGTTVVQARNVSKVFKREAFEVKALDDVSIDIGAGEFMALMGPSGSGKTTLLNMIAAIDRPTSGELLVQNQNIFRFNDSQAVDNKTPLALRQSRCPATMEPIRPAEPGGTQGARPV